MNEAAPRAAIATPLDDAAIRRIVIGVMLAMLLAAMEQTIVATALPTIGNELRDLEHLSWVVTAYLLSATAVTPFYGKLADIIGRRTVLLIAIGVFIAGSILCALAPSMWFLIGARFIQGLGGGGLIALAQTIVADVVSAKDRMRYQAYFASVFVTSSIAGPILGGFFAERLHWSFIFWINLPLGLLALAMTNNVLKRLPRHERPHKLDVVGAVLMVAATVALLLALSWGGGVYPWGSPQIVGLFVGSGIAWALFVVRLLTAPEPFVPLSVMFNDVVAAGTAASFFVVGTMLGLTIYVPIYFEAVLGLSAAQSGLALIAFAGATVVGAQIAGRTMVWTPHYKRGPLIGLVVAIITTVILAVLAPVLNLLWVEVLLAIAGIGMGTIFPVTTIGIQNAVENHQLGTATATFNFFRSLGSAILVAVFGAIFLGGLGLAGSTIGSLDALVAQAAANGTAVAPVFTYVFGAAAAILALGLVSLVLMRELPLKGH